MINGILQNKFSLCFLGFLFLVCMLPTYFKVFFFQMPGQSDKFDCDDAVLLMHDRLHISGVRSDIMAGNLNYSGEKFKDIDHVWLVVNLSGVKIPVDWGTPKFDRQHYEGYVVDRVQLEQWVNADIAERETTGKQYEPAYRKLAINISPEEWRLISHCITKQSILRRPGFLIPD